MEKRTWIGWAASYDFPDIFNWKRRGHAQYLDIDTLPDMFKLKGKKEDWMDGDWPPVKVKITVEVSS